MSARRLTLGPAEWAVLAAGALPDAPPGFAPASPEPAQRAAAVSALAGRGVLAAGGAGPVPAVEAQLEVLRRPAVTLRLDVEGPGGARRAWFAVGAGVVVGVLAVAGGGVELSLAPAVRLGEELARAVPDAVTVTGRAPGPDLPPLDGRVPLALLAGEPDAETGADDLALVQSLEQRTAGSLACLVLGRSGGELAAGQVSWLATDTGWLGLRPHLEGSPRLLVDLVPVRPVDLGTWLAPTLAPLLEGSDEQP